MEISEQVVNLGAKGDGNDDTDDDHAILSDDEDIVMECIGSKVATPRTGKCIGRGGGGENNERRICWRVLTSSVGSGFSLLTPPPPLHALKAPLLFE